MENDPGMVVSARIEGSLARWFEDFRWSERKSISDVVREALIEYRERRPENATPKTVTIVSHGEAVDL